MELSKDLSIRIDRLVDREDSHVKAYASATIGGAFAIHGLRVVDSEKGAYVLLKAHLYMSGL